MSGASPPTDTAWGPLCLRLGVVTLPAQIIGALLGSLPGALLGPQALAVPWASSLVLVGMGAAAGLTFGLLSRPPSDRWALAVGLAAGFGLIGFLVLRLLTQLRVEGAPSSLTSWLLGALIVVGVQSIVVALVWRRRL